ncbi:hypothetical protein OAV62_01205 [bacterium]|nr:hypothetical protein [bacterium]
MRKITLTIDTFNNSVTTEVNLYPLDTVETFSNRLVARAYVLPQYVHIPEFDIETVDDITITSLGDPVHPPVPYVKKFENYFPIETILTYWANFHPIEMLSFMILELRPHPEIIDAFPEDNSFEVVMEAALDHRRERFVQNYINQKSPFEQEQANIEQFLLALEEVPEYPLDLEKSVQIEISGTFEAPGNLDYIFDRIDASTVFPVIVHKSYYKIQEHYILMEGWSMIEDQIRVKFVIGETSSELLLSKTDTGFEFTSGMLSKTVPEDVYKEYISKLLDSFSIEYNETIPIYHYMMDTLVNIRILSDIVMTIGLIEPIFGITTNRPIYDEYGDRRLFFRNPYVHQSPKRFIQINQKGSRRASFVIRENDPLHSTMRKLLSQLLTIYVSNESIVREEYFSLGLVLEAPEVISDERVVEENRVQTKRGLFDAGWSSQCQPTTRHPIILSKREQYLVKALDIEMLTEVESRMIQPKNVNKRVPLLDDARQLVNKYKKLQIIQYPKDEENYFICTNPTFPYPGMIKNDKSELGYQPCCFKVDKRKSKAFKAYYQGVSDDAAKSSSYIITKDKIITQGVLGQFSPITRQYTNLITKCFDYATNPTKERILRFGIRHTRNSFLECVLVGLKLDISNVDQVRQNLLDGVDPNFLRQEMFRFTPDQITDYIESDAFLNPLFTIRLLEYKFKCNILLFRRDNEHPAGTISFPHHRKGYMKWRRNKRLPTIMIYMHTGAVSDNIEFPHCELIIHVPRTVNTHRKVMKLDNPFSFSENNYIAEFCWGLYEDLGYEQNCKSTLDILPIDEDDCKAQWIDEFGKMRMVVVRMNGEHVLLGTPPYPPINKIVIDPSTFSISEEKMIDVFGKIPQSGQNYIPITYFDRELRLYTQPSGQFFEKSIFNEKVSRAMLDWSIYLFSKFLKDEGTSLPSRDQMESFSNSMFEVSSDIVYDRPGPLFTEATSGNIIQNGRIMCTSHDVRNRIVFNLWRELIRRETTVLNYSKKSALPTYYDTIFDFRSVPGNNIFVYDQTVEESLLKLVSAPTTYKLYDYPQNKGQYFLQHRKVEDGSLVRVENYVTTESILPNPQYPYLLYMFHSSTNVERIFVNEDPIIPPMKILVTRFDNIVLYGKLTIPCV